MGNVQDMVTGSIKSGIGLAAQYAQNRIRALLNSAVGKVDAAQHGGALDDLDEAERLGAHPDHIARVEQYIRDDLRRLSLFARPL